jgi:hypothetical protein
MSIANVRPHQKVKVAVERLDERIVPVAFGHFRAAAFGGAAVGPFVPGQAPAHGPLTPTTAILRGGFRPGPFGPSSGVSLGDGLLIPSFTRGGQSAGTSGGLFIPTATARFRPGRATVTGVFVPSTATNTVLALLQAMASARANGAATINTGATSIPSPVSPVMVVLRATPRVNTRAMFLTTSNTLSSATTMPTGTLTFRANNRTLTTRLLNNLEVSPFGPNFGFFLTPNTFFTTGGAAPGSIFSASPTFAPPASIFSPSPTFAPVSSIFGASPTFS